MILGRSALDAENIVAWLRSRNPNLEWRKPLEVLVEPDGFFCVLDEAKSIAGDQTPRYHKLVSERPRLASSTSARELDTALNAFMCR